jgi:tetratricopeptide (TPR) repeat protein
MKRTGRIQHLVQMSGRCDSINMPEKKRSIWLVLIGVFGAVLVVVIVLSAVLYMLPGLAAFVPQDVSPLADKSEQIAAMQAIIEQLRFLLGGLALGLTGIVAIQAAFQARHDRMQASSVQQVSEVMTVVRETLKERLDAEQDQRRRADSLQHDLDSINAFLDEVRERNRLQDEIIAQERQEIESKANQLAGTARHDFRDRVGDLTGLARRFDTFKSQFERMEKPARTFSDRVLYIRGIAAHYDNDPTQALQYLEQVTQPAEGIDREQRSVVKRIANAYYYQGITHSNFGHLDQAKDCFDRAIAPDAHGQDSLTRNDFLTRVVYAEALAMSAQPEETYPKLARPTGIITDIERRPTKKAAEQRLRSRALLIIANIHVLNNRLTDAARPLAVVMNDDPDYYYATLTLAQVLARTGSPDAAARFREAYDAILKSNHLYLVTEARSKALLHMAAALCLRQMGDSRHSDEQVEAARALLPGLPVLTTGSTGAEPCTVFSVLSKRNEHGATIAEHINAIASGEVLRPGATS